MVQPTTKRLVTEAKVAGHVLTSLTSPGATKDAFAAEISDQIATPGTPAATALSATYGPAAQAAAPELKAAFAPRPGNRVAFIGDSTLQGYASDAPVGGDTTHRYGVSWPSMSATKSNQRIQIAKHAGDWGDTSANMNTRFAADVAAYNPNAVVILAGRNDPDVATTMTNIAALVGKVRAIGAIPILCTPLPTNDAAHKQRMASTATKIRAYAANNRVAVIDFNALATDVDGNLKTIYNNGDGIHPAYEGIDAMSDLAWPIIADLLPPAARLTATNDADTENLVQQPLFRAASANGTVSPWARGSTPTWATYSVVDVAGWAGKAQQIATVAHPTVEGDANIRQTIAVGANLAVGDVIEFAGKVKITSTLPQGKQVMVRILFEGNGEIIAALETNRSIDGTFLIRHAVPTGTTGARIMFLISPDTVGSATAQFGEITFRNLTKLGLL